MQLAFWKKKKEDQPDTIIESSRTHHRRINKSDDSMKLIDEQLLKLDGANATITEQTRIITEALKELEEQQKDTHGK